MAVGGRRFAVWLVLAGYLFSVTVAMSFHDHGQAGPFHAGSHGDRDGHPDVEFSLRHAQRGTDSGARVAVGRGDDSSATPSHGSCVVCQFLSQKVLPTRSIGAVCSEPLRTVTALRLPVVDVAAPVRIHHSRAPPSLA
jgi:hypothetical protein